MPIIIELARRFAPWIALGGLILLLLIAGPATCHRLRDAQARARLSEEQARAASGSGQDAVATVGAAAHRDQQSDDLTTTNDLEIRHAQGANAPIDPAVHNSGIGSLCRRAAYRDSEQCRMRRPAAR